MNEAKRFRWSMLVVLLAAVLALASCDAKPKPQAVNNPLFGLRLYSGQAIHAITAEHDLRREGRETEANEIAKLSKQPTATWLTGTEYDGELLLNTLAAANPGETLIFVLYNLPHRDIGSGHSEGGAISGESYKRWIKAMSAEVGNREAIVIVEPDGVAAVAENRLQGGQASQRLELINYAVAEFAGRPKAHIYIDAGNAGWKSPTDMAGPLQTAGVKQADGIAVNVSNFYSDEDSTHYGQAISELVGGTGVVVDTSRNGNGPLASDDPLHWCNPPGRAIGRTPAIGGQTDVVQAWLWIKPPGDSDGSCRPGEPPAGQFWLDYALGLVKGK